MRFYTFEIVIEKEAEDDGYAACSPTLPGCFGNGKTIEGAKRNIREDDPDQVRRSARLGSARLFSRWFPELRGGKHMVLVVVSESVAAPRHWIVTAYIARRLAQGDVEWKRG